MRVDVSTWLKFKVASRRSLSRRGVEDHSTNLNDIAIKLTGVNSETPSLSLLYLKSREMPKQFLSVLSLYFPRNNENSYFWYRAVNLRGFGVQTLFQSIDSVHCLVTLSCWPCILYPSLSIQRGREKTLTIKAGYMDPSGVVCLSPVSLGRH